MPEKNCSTSLIVTKLDPGSVPQGSDYFGVIEPCVKTRPNRVTVRWPDDLIIHFSTEGRTMEPGETVKVTAGLPEDSVLVDAKLCPDHTVAFVFETEEDLRMDEVRVELSTGFRHGQVPVEAIGVLTGCVGQYFVEEEDSEALKIVLRWLDSLGE